jgi:thioredoxin reductase (NADPH)
MTEEFDVIIIGGGPAGLSAAINTATEGLKTAVMSSKPWGGQARDSALIENYPGFPYGISGEDLVAKNFVAQAERLEAQLRCPEKAVSIAVDGNRRIVMTEDGDELVGNAIIIASGLSYNKLKAKNLSAFVGRGVSYGAPTADLVREKKKYCVVGGANSAGQAAVHLAMRDPEAAVRMLVRGPNLSATMSHYLIQKLGKLPNLEVLYNTEVEEARGESILEQVAVKMDGQRSVMDTDALYIFIGAAPKTFWLKDTLKLDDRKYIVTGHSLKDAWTLPREPYGYETSIPGVFCAGDIRAGSKKRVVAVAGEGGATAQHVYTYLATLNHK